MPGANIALLLYERFDSELALVVGDEHLTFGSYRARAASLAAWLISQVRGEHVAVMLPNLVETMPCCAAVLCAGKTLVTLPPSLGDDELAFVLDDLDVAGLITTDDVHRRLTASPALRGGVDTQQVLVVGASADAPWRYGDVLQSYQPLPSPPDRGASDIAAIVPTTGTSGRPKGVVFTHGNLRGAVEALAGSRQRGGWTASGMSALNAPLGTIGALAALLRGWLTGDALVLLQRGAPADVLEALASHSVRTLVGVPTLLSALVAYPEADAYDLSALERCLVGGDTVTAELARAFERRFGVPARPVYGLTETCGAITDAQWDREEVDCAGVVWPQVDVRITDPRSGEVLPEGEVGEICLRADFISAGYYKRDALNAETFRDGWFHSGDLGSIDSARRLTIEGRKKELIIQAGHNISPREIEAVIEADPDVAECAVVALPSEVLGEVAAAFVVARAGATLSVDSVLERCRAKLTPHKRPAEVHLLDALPRSPLGKVRRGVLRQLGREQRPDHALRAALLVEPQNRRRALIRDLVATHAASMLGADARGIDRSRSLFDLGLDSLGAIGLARSLSRSLGVEISETIAFDDGTVDGLALWLDDKLMGTQREPERVQLTIGSHEPVAIVGWSCRVPGADDPEALWRWLLDGGDATREIPAERWDVDKYYDVQRGTPGKMYTRRGAFVDGFDMFDGPFFGLSTVETLSHSPEQRWLLETAWHALEHAGETSDVLRRSRTGVFFGLGENGYRNEQHQIAGICMAVGRLSHVLDLQGPCLPVDTACSSSLVAIHLACRSLRSGECDLAISGGASHIPTPAAHIALSRVNALSPDGRCKTFDVSADGYGRGEGCVALVLKRLDRARADGNNILAVIHGSAVNHDGRASTLTAPNRAAQESVVRAALTDAGMHGDDIGYLEAHGTGTPLGDPIEMAALANSLQRRPDNRLLVGSIKANVGHLEVAAGAAGVLKAAMICRHGLVPPQANFTNLNPRIDLDAIPARIPTEATPLPRGRPRLAGVSSFGISGTNAHVVVGAPPALDTRAGARAKTAERDAHVLCLSARSPKALSRLCQRFVEHLAVGDAQDLADICYTVNARRAHFEHRLAVVASDREEMRARLARELARESDEGERAASDLSLSPAVARAAAAHPAHIALLFDERDVLGGDTRDLLRTLQRSCPALHEALAIAAPLWAQQGPEELLELLDVRRDAARASLAAEERAALRVTVQWALWRCWSAWGLAADAVAGVGSGAIAAACAAGALELEAALAIARAHGALAATAPLGRAFVVHVDGAGDTALAAIAEVEGSRVVARSAEREIVVAAPLDHCDALETRLGALTRAAVRALGGEPMRLPAAFAPQRAQDEFAARVRDAGGGTSELLWLSAQDGSEIDSADAPAWLRGVSQPVNLPRLVAALDADVLLQVGVGDALLARCRRCATRSDQSFVASLRPGRSPWRQLVESIAQIHTRGVALDWRAFDDGHRRRVVALPCYPFERRRYVSRGIADEAAEQPLARYDSGELDRMLGKRLATARPVFEQLVDLRRHPFVGEHRVHSRVVMPGAALLSQLLAAATLDTPSGSVAELDIEQPMTLDEDALLVVQTCFDGALEHFEVFSRLAHDATDGADRADEGATWTRHARGRLGAAPSAAVATSDDSVAAMMQRCARVIEPEALYEDFAAAQLELGPAFRCLRDIRCGDGEGIARVQLDHAAAVDAAAFCAHPALLDSLLHMTGVVGQAGQRGQGGSAGAKERGALLPVAMEDVRLYREVPAHGWCYTKVLSRGEAPRFSVRYLDDAGDVVLDIGSVMLRRARRQDIAVRGPLLALRWREDAPPTAPEPALDALRDAAVYLVGQGGALADALAAELTDLGARVFHIDDAAQLRASMQGSAGSLQRVVLLGALTGGADGVSLEGLMRDLEGSSHQLLRAVQASDGCRARFFVVTRGAQAARGETELALGHSPVWALARALRLEQPDLACQCIDLDPRGDRAADTAALLRELAAPSVQEPQLALREDNRLVARLAAAQKPGELLELPDAPNYQLQRADSALLDDLRVVPTQRHSPAAGRVEVRVRATGLNFRDLMNALGTYPGGGGPLGGDIAGEVSAVGAGVTGFEVGERVVGFGVGGFSRTVDVSADALRRVPAGLTLAQAATLPSAFCTAYLALVQRAELQAGETVLIHAAAGGVGLAAVQIAQHIGARVIGTASSERKRSYLRSLGVEHVTTSRSLSFADDVRALTAGRGVDVVLNSLAGELMAETFAVLREEGRFVEIGKTGIWSAEQVARVKPRARYFVIALDALLAERPREGGALLDATLQHLAAGHYRPLPSRTFSLQHAREAFRFMQQARHIGKIVVAQEHFEPGAFAARAHGSYVIAGGLGALGLLCARWLVQRGARALVLVGRRPPPHEACPVLDALRASGASVRCESADIAEPSDVQRVLAAARELGPLRGVINAAGVLDDGVVAQQSWQRFERVMRPKVAGSWNLHVATRDDPLDFFVMYSSVASLLGSPGQTNYAAANGFEDALAHWRRLAGRPAHAINWAAWSEVGMAAGLARAGGVALSSDEGLELLERALASDEPQLGAFPAGWKPRALGGPYVEELVRGARGRPAQRPGRTARSGEASRIAAAPPAQRFAMIGELLREAVARVLDVDVASIDPEQRLEERGLDSLLAVELRNQLNVSLGAARALPVSFVYEQPTLAAMTRYLVSFISGEEGVAEGGQVLVELAAGASGAAPLYVVHGLSGLAQPFAVLAERLASTRSVIGVRSPLVTQQLAGVPTVDVEPTAARYVESILARQPDGPYALVGWSLGAVFAWEMATQLVARGHSVEPLVLIDCIAPGHPFIELGFEPVIADRNVERALLAAYGRYAPKAYDGPVRVVRCRDTSFYRAALEAAPAEQRATLWQGFLADEMLGWGSIAAGATAVAVSGAHESCLQPPHVDELARCIVDALAGR
ncbi:MAG: SDR family NAD(P)-dependent oxidoreductase [Myxococcales bacterium]|nr:SDR family NAD(P)-dependent oxidoreductase [Myxococcales bacterium]